MSGRGQRARSPPPLCLPPPAGQRKAAAPLARPLTASHLATERLQAVAERSEALERPRLRSWSGWRTQREPAAIGSSCAYCESRRAKPNNGRPVLELQPAARAHAVRLPASPGLLSPASLPSLADLLRDIDLGPNQLALGAPTTRLAPCELQPAAEPGRSAVCCAGARHRASVRQAARCKRGCRHWRRRRLSTVSLTPCLEPVPAGLSLVAGVTWELQQSGPDVYRKLGEVGADAMGAPSGHAPPPTAHHRSTPGLHCCCCLAP